MKVAKKVLNGLEKISDCMKSAKPEGDGELARRYADTITELEKMIATFKFYVAGD